MADWQADTLTLRRDIFLAAQRAGMAHLASAYSCVEILYALYARGVLRHDGAQPLWPERDRLILSKGHGSLALYAMLCREGYFSREELMRFACPGSLLGGEPSLCPEKGIEASTGSLGHGLSLGVGLALGARLDGSPSRTFVLLGDGECEEGSVWEAVMSAVKYQLDNLVILVDENRIQKMDTVEAVMGVRDWQARFAAFGCHCASCDGHDVEALVRALSAPHPGAPLALFCRTVKGKGVSLMENNPGWHWRMPNRRELKVFLAELGLSGEELDECRRPI